MDALLRKISEFKDSIGEPMGFDTINSKKKVNLVQFPIAKEDAFYGKAKGWLDDLLMSCTTANDTSQCKRAPLRWY